MIALCYEQTPKQSMFPFAIMLQILKNHYISLIVKCHWLLHVRFIFWLRQSGILFSDEVYTFHSLSHNNIWLQKTWNSTQRICNTSVLCFGHFFYNALLSLYIYLVILLILFLSNVWKHYNLYISVHYNIVKQLCSPNEPFIVVLEKGFFSN